jgi:hypothetical protein
MPNVGLANDVVIDSKRYVVHKERGRVLWRVQETQEEVPGESGSFVSEGWLEGGHLGMGETEKESKAGYYFSDNMDATQKGWIRLSPQINTAPQTGSFTMKDDTNVVFWEAQDTNNNSFVYVAHRQDTSNTNSIKIVPGTDEASVSGTVNHVTANAADPTRPARYNGDLYLVLSGSTSRVENLRELTLPVAAVDVADTWASNDTATSGFYGLTTFQEGGDATLLRIKHQASAEKYTASTPLVNAGWTTTAIKIGDPGEVGADVGVSGETPFVSTRLGCYVFDGTRAVLRAPIKRDRTPLSGAGLGTFPFSDIIFYPHQHLWRIRGHQSLPVSPDDIEGYRDVGLSAPIAYRHRHGDASEGKWFYSIYTDDSTSYILAGRLREDSRGLGESDDEIVWHTLVKRSVRTNGLFVDTFNNRLWWGEPANDRVAYINLAADGSPNTTDNRGAASTTFTYTFPETNFGLPDTLKEFHRVDVLVENWPDAADAPLQIQYAKDGATSWTNLSSTITADGLNKRFFTPSVDGYRIRLRLSITTGAAFNPSSDDPRIKSVIIHALPRPDKADVFRAVINATETADLMKKSHKGVRDALKNLENADPVTIKDLYHDSYTAQVFAVSDLESRYTDDGSYALINVWMREVPTA